MISYKNIAGDSLKNKTLLYDLRRKMVEEYDNFKQLFLEITTRDKTYKVQRQFFHNPDEFDLLRKMLVDQVS